MNETPNHGYNVPDEGTTDWHLALNENFERFDTEVEIRDTEANKGDYEPKDGAKYEATDSGAVYLGNGNSWVLASRRVHSLEAESINSVKTPSGTDIESFRAAAEGGGVVRLKPGVTYEWDETFIFDPEDRDSNLRVEAHRATIEHDSDPAVDVRTIYRDGSNLSPVTLTWSGGTFRGPGANNGSSVDPDGVPDYAPSVETGSCVFRLTDAWNHTIDVRACREVRAGIYVRNEEWWSEANELSAGANADTVDFCYLCLGGSYLGTSGGGSMRGMQLKHDWGSGKGSKATIYQGGAGFHGGNVYHTGNLPKNGWGWWADGNLEGTDVHWESEFGTENSVDIQFEGNTKTPPPFTARLTGSSDEAVGDGGGIVNNRYQDVFFRQGGSEMGMTGADGKKGYRIPAGPGNDVWSFQSPTMLHLGSVATNNPSDLGASNGRDNIGNEHTEMRFHNGSGSKPVGWYWWDEDGSVSEGDRWVKIGDPSTVISPY
ncbi:hypothetical protein I7X12_06925 [Halosimplex litoreum]|uniref:Uncharacterized protein n=1 Tax=Halosimplex litoreum TaxID=1198301 RepID=A0A7T3G0X3_9EURY|nr:hypothetical protein [Halosimplex litoreum]QPV64341.1 hypothetical protein I7X12_06925 [Halosimplex litoreum]